MLSDHEEMQCVVNMVNRYNGLSAFRFVDQIMQTKGSRLPRYFYFDETQKSIDGLKQLAQRFKWDQQNLTRWFTKHFVRFVCPHLPSSALCGDDGRDVMTDNVPDTVSDAICSEPIMVRNEGYPQCASCSVVSGIIL